MCLPCGTVVMRIVDAVDAFLRSHHIDIVCLGSNSAVTTVGLWQPKWGAPCLTEVGRMLIDGVIPTEFITAVGHVDGVTVDSHLWMVVVGSTVTSENDVGCGVRGVVLSIQGGNLLLVLRGTVGGGDIEVAVEQCGVPVVIVSHRYPVAVAHLEVVEVPVARLYLLTFTAEGLPVVL